MEKSNGEKYVQNSQKKIGVPNVFMQKNRILMESEKRQKKSCEILPILAQGFRSWSYPSNVKDQ